jgi:prophage antirepressor-like protein
MDILRVFQLKSDTFPINIKGTDENPLFHAKQIGTILGIVNIRETMRMFDADEKVVVSTDSLGGPQLTIFLTEIGLYRLLGMSRKPAARVFQKWVVRVVREIRLQGKYELRALKEQMEVDEKLAKNKEARAKHNTFLTTLDCKHVVYFTKVLDTDDDRFMVKLGYTDNIQARNRQHANDYGTSLLLDVFECNDNRRFELFLKRHPKVGGYLCTDEVNGRRSNELILVNDHQYAGVLDVIKHNICYYTGYSPEHVLEHKRLQLLSQALELVATDPQSEILKQLVSMISSSKQQNQPDEADTEVKKEEFQDEKYETPIPDWPYSQDFERSPDDKPRANSKNKWIQQYDPHTFELIKTYEGLMDVIRQNKHMSKIGVKSAILKNTVYNNYRWMFVDPADSKKKHNLEPTNDIHSSLPKMVAMLNTDKTRIEKVYATQQEAATALNLKQKTAINNAIMKGTMSKGNYFVFFTDCTEQLRNEYMAREALPPPPANKGLSIQQIDPKTNVVINTFDSMASVLKEIHMSRATLKRACAFGEVHKGYLWKQYND